MSDLPAQTTTASSPKDRLEHDKKVEAEFKAARNLIEEHRYSAALKKVKWVFANNKEKSSIFFYFDITDLVRNYPPARVAAKRWRNDKEKLIVEHRADGDLIREWIKLNEILREPKRTYEVIFKVAQATESEEYRQTLTLQIWKQLARNRKYDLLKNCLQDMVLRVLLKANDHDGETLFPDPNDSKDRKRWKRESLLDYMRNEGCLAYEVALGLGEKKVAAVFAKKILSVETNDAMFARLIRAAIRAKDYEEAVQVYQLARETFTKRRLSKSTKMLKSMPKTRLAKFASDVGL